MPRATYQDVIDAPPNQVAEIIAGTLHTHPRRHRVTRGQVRGWAAC